MNCNEARKAMLVAEPSELRGESSTTLAAHLATCEACARLGLGFAGDAGRLSSEIRTRSRRRVAILAALPIAATILVVVMLASRDEPTPKRLALDPPPPSRVISVDIAPGQRAAVLKTADPSVTLVWFTPGE
jgi:hypothetical protein